MAARVPSVDLNTTSISFYIGGTTSKKVTATFNDNGTAVSLHYGMGATSNNTSVATVSGGSEFRTNDFTITMVGKGTATITIMSSYKIGSKDLYCEATCTVSVSDPTIYSIDTPYQSKTLTYNGNTLYPTMEADSKLASPTGKTSAKDHSDTGGYGLHYTLPTDTEDSKYLWKDGRAIRWRYVYWNIDKAEVGINWGTTTFEYDGTEHHAEGNITGLFGTDTCTATYEGAQKDAGKGTTKVATISSTTNYKIPAAGLSTKIEVTLREVGVKWGQHSWTYDNEDHLAQATISRVIDGDDCTFSYGGTKAKNVGDTGPTTVSLKGVHTSNYKLPSSGTSQDLEITKADYDMTGVSFSDLTADFDNTDHTINITGTLPTGLDEIQVTCLPVYNTRKNAGSNTAYAFFYTKSSNYNTPSRMTATITINKINYDMSKIRYMDETITYDGSSHMIKIKGDLPTGLDGSIVSVSYNNSITHVSESPHTCKATFSTTSSTNYNIPAAKTATLTITPAAGTMTWDPTISFSFEPSSSDQYTASLAAALNILGSLSYTASDASTGLSWVNTTGHIRQIKLAANKGEGTYSIKITAADTGDDDHNTKSISKTITIYVVAQGIIYIKIGDTWKKALCYIKTDTGWKKSLPYLKTANGWKKTVG